MFVFEKKRKIRNKVNRRGNYERINAERVHKSYRYKYILAFHNPLKNIGICRFCNSFAPIKINTRDFNFFFVETKKSSVAERTCGAEALNTELCLLQKTMNQRRRVEILIFFFRPKTLQLEIMNERMVRTITSTRNRRAVTKDKNQSGN